MKRTGPPISSLAFVLLCVLVCVLLWSGRVLVAQEGVEGRFDWDLISLEQNNNRFNGSVLSGFHSIRSPGVTPSGAWKTGLGLLYSHEEQSASSGSTVRTLETDRITVNPKINVGFFEWFEAGLGIGWRARFGHIALGRLKARVRYCITLPEELTPDACDSSRSRAEVIKGNCRRHCVPRYAEG